MTRVTTPTRAQRGTPLTRDEILRVALRLIDRDGVDAFSMRKLGRELQVDPMAVYHHVRDRAAVFDGIVELVWREVSIDDIDARLPWRETTFHVMTQLREVLRSHPNIVPIVGTRPAITPGLLILIERLLETLVGAGLRPAEALRLGNCLTVFTIGHALAEVAEPVGGGDTLTYSNSIAAVLGSGDYPGLAAAMGDMSQAEEPGIAFDAGITAMLRGWHGLPD